MVSEYELPRIIDIRQGPDHLDLKEEIVRGLELQPPMLPELLLWSDRGQSLFDRYSLGPSYYPFHSELEILSKYGHEVEIRMPANGAILELGCGSTRKTQFILAHFCKQQKPIQYFALDVSHQSLTESLTGLRISLQDAPMVSITGLLGTYDDCVAWLAACGANNMGSNGSSDLNGLRGGVDGRINGELLTSLTILWLGNSIANLETQAEASTFLSRFGAACRDARLKCQFIVSADICRNKAKIREAYRTGRPEFRNWLLSSLEAANLALCHEAFAAADWAVADRLEGGEGSRGAMAMEIYVKPKRDLQVPLVPPGEIGNGGGEKTKAIAFRKGELVRVIRSGKWGEKCLMQVSESAGFSVQQCWRDSNGDYGEQSGR
ncbi:N-methyltransferase [Apiospora arundinis]